MIQIKRYQDCAVNLREVVARSPVADVPGALEILHRRIVATQNVSVGYIKGEVACIYGLAPPTVLSNQAHIWVITTDVAEQNKFLFIRHSQIVIEEALKHWEHIYGETYVKDKHAFKWIKWLGGFYGHPMGMFVPFSITRPSFEGRRWQTQ